jgi:prolyl-tRNA synthetase
VPYYFDRSVEETRNFLCGGNEKDIHYTNVNIGRDFPEIKQYYDLTKVQAGQYCPNCKNPLNEEQGIELGHIFQLQQVYSQSMHAEYIDSSGNSISFWMGCYGIGVSRAVQAIVEQKYDNRGIVWPFHLAPYHAIVIPVSNEYDTYALELYEEMRALGIEVVIDDRSARLGEKLVDAELCGWPLQIIVGKTWLKNKTLEVKWRDANSFDSSIFTIRREDYLPEGIMAKDGLFQFIKSITR